MSISIYEIDRAIMDLVDPETGEILDWEALEALQLEREAKIENVACWYKNLVAEAKAIREEEKALAERRKAVEAMAERRKRYLEDALGGQKFQTARCSITFRKTTKVDLQDEQAAIEWCQKNGRDDVLKYAAPEVNKTELTKLLKDGVTIPGAELVAGLSMGVK